MAFFGTYSLGFIPKDKVRFRAVSIVNKINKIIIDQLCYIKIYYPYMQSYKTGSTTEVMFALGCCFCLPGLLSIFLIWSDGEVYKKSDVIVWNAYKNGHASY